jgi:hypothetical protein
MQECIRTACGVVIVVRAEAKAAALVVVVVVGAKGPGPEAAAERHGVSCAAVARVVMLGRLAMRREMSRWVRELMRLG